MKGIPAFFGQETGQGFLVVGGALWAFWQGGAPPFLLYIVGGLGGLYIVGEKVRAIFRPEK